MALTREQQQQLTDISYYARLVGFLLLFLGVIIPGVLAWAVADVATVLKYRGVVTSFWRKWNYTGMGLSTIGAVAVILTGVFPPFGILGLMVFALGTGVTHLGVTMGVTQARLSTAQRITHIGAAVLMIGLFLMLAMTFPPIGIVFPAAVVMLGKTMVWMGLFAYFGGAAFSAPTMTGKLGWSTLGLTCLGVSLLAIFPPAAFVAFGLAALCGIGCLANYFKQQPQGGAGGAQGYVGVPVGTRFNDDDDFGAARPVHGYAYEPQPRGGVNPFGEDDPFVEDEKGEPHRTDHRYPPSYTSQQDPSHAPRSGSFTAFSGQGHKLSDSSQIPVAVPARQPYPAPGSRSQPREQKRGDGGSRGNNIHTGNGARSPYYR